MSRGEGGSFIDHPTGMLFTSRRLLVELVYGRVAVRWTDRRQSCVTSLK
jgi:hypothetical protein